MKRFIIRLLLMCLPAVGFIGYTFNRADGHTDPFYVRFTTPRQSSLILGTSRAAQGLRPDVLNPVLGRDDVFNCAFTVIQSPYGPVYLDSIKNKLDPGTRDGVFIVTVDPWSVSSFCDTQPASDCSDPNDPQGFRERHLRLDQVRWVNLNPNVPYVLKYLMPLIDLYRPGSPYLWLHQDGWLEVSVAMNTAVVHKRINSKIQE